MPDREKVIKGLEHCSFGENRGCAGCPYNDECGDWGQDAGVGSLCTDALALLKEQEPKPVKVKKNAYNHEFYHCPNCDREFYGPYKRPNYCDQCGQAVKWDD